MPGAAHSRSSEGNTTAAAVRGTPRPQGEKNVGFGTDVGGFPRETANILTPLSSTCFFVTSGFC